MSNQHILLGCLDGFVRRVFWLPRPVVGTRDIAENGSEAEWAGDLTILPPENLTQLINHLRGNQLLSAPVARAEPVPPGRI